MAQVRRSYPGLDAFNDQAFADAIYDHYYAKIPREQYYAQIGFTSRHLPVADGQTPQSARPPLAFLAMASGFGGNLQKPTQSILMLQITFA